MQRQRIGSTRAWVVGRVARSRAGSGASIQPRSRPSSARSAGRRRECRRVVRDRSCHRAPARASRCRDALAPRPTRLPPRVAAPPIVARRSRPPTQPRTSRAVVASAARSASSKRAKLTSCPRPSRAAINASRPRALGRHQQEQLERRERRLRSSTTSGTTTSALASAASSSALRRSNACRTSAAVPRGNVAGAAGTKSRAANPLVTCLSSVSRGWRTSSARASSASRRCTQRGVDCARFELRPERHRALTQTPPGRAQRFFARFSSLKRRPAMPSVCGNGPVNAERGTDTRTKPAPSSPKPRSS